MAAKAVCVTQFRDVRKDCFALLVGKRAAWMKLAAARAIEQAWHFALQFEAVDLGIGVGFRVGRQ